MATTHETGVARRDLLAALGGIGIAVLGAGFERPAGTVSAAGTVPPPPFDVTLRVTPWSDAAETTGRTPPSTPPARTPGTSPERRSRGERAGGGAGTVPTDGDDAVRMANALPGDEGVVTATLTVAGAPVSLDLYADAFDFTEGTVVEPERSRDGTPGAGELQDRLEVVLWLDGDGDGAVGADEQVFYEGPLAGLRALRSGVTLDACVPVGVHRLRLGWHLPADVGNAVQTDGATIGLSCVARSCSEPGGE
jgi:hypothetical protein